MLSDKDIQLREISIDDTELILKWRNLPSVKQNLYSQEVLTAEQHLWWIENKVNTGECAQFIIENTTLSIPIGTVFIKNIDKNNKKGEFGIFIGEDFARGQGYGTIATSLILNYAFENLLLNRIYLTVFEDNQSAIRSYKNAGFNIEGVMREHYKRNGNFCNIVCMAVLYNEWKHKKMFSNL